MSVLHLTNSNFDESIANGTVLVDFWAPWCAPCRMLGPVIEEIAAEKPEVTVAKVNIDDEPELAQRFGVMSIPTVISFKGGKQEAQSVGLVPKERIIAML